MSKICIHIGTHKTATTHIQTLFEKNAALLGRNGVIVPRLTPEKRHHPLAGVWNKGFGEDPTAARALWHKLASDHARSDRTVFVSSEELSRLRPITSRVDMAEMRSLVAAFDEVILLCTFRNQAGFIQSIYQQVSSSRGAETWDPFLKTALREKSCDGLSLNYDRLYSHFLTGFARNEVRLLSYDRESITTAGMAGAVLREIGCTLDPAKLRPVSPEVSNVSAPPLVTFAANQLCPSDPASPALYALIQTQIDHSYGPGKRTTLFTPTEVAQITESFTASNAALKQRIAYCQPEFEIGAMLPQGADLYRDKLNKAFWIALAQRLALSSSI